MKGCCENGRYNPCKDCPDRYIACSYHCRNPAFLAWKAEQETIRKNREQYMTPIWTHGDRDQRRK